MASRRRQDLLARKQQLLRGIDICVREIATVRDKSQPLHQPLEDSSDSDCELPLPESENTNTHELETLEMLHKNSFGATAELSGVDILDREMEPIDQPLLNGNRNPTEPGFWWEFTAKCRADLVSFSISFNIFRPSSDRTLQQYYNINVSLSKSTHGNELTQAKLVKIKTPSEAVRVLRSYAREYRSRYTTVRTLEDKYNCLLSGHVPQGCGIWIKFSNLLTVTWQIRRQRSPVSNFIHKLKINAEPLGESHQEMMSEIEGLMSNSIKTEERLFLLCQLFDILADEVLSVEERDEEREESTSHDRDPENRQNNERREGFNEKTSQAKNDRDFEVMAPPKELPKKAKSKNNASQIDITNKTIQNEVVKKVVATKRPLNSTSNATDNSDGADPCKKLKLKPNTMVIKEKKTPSNLNPNNNHNKPTVENTNKEKKIPIQKKDKPVAAQNKVIMQSDAPKNLGNKKVSTNKQTGFVDHSVKPQDKPNKKEAILTKSKDIAAIRIKPKVKNAENPKGRQEQKFIGGKNIQTKVMPNTQKITIADKTDMQRFNQNKPKSNEKIAIKTKESVTTVIKQGKVVTKIPIKVVPKKNPLLKNNNNKVQDSRTINTQKITATDKVDKQRINENDKNVQNKQNIKDKGTIKTKKTFPIRPEAKPQQKIPNKKM